MQQIKKAILKPLSRLYITGVKIRHWLFDRSILRSEEFDIPIVCIGNITVGGTGKSPMSELLLEELSPKHKIAILSRGYGRKSRGYIEVKEEDNYLNVGDEPLQIKRKYSDVVVVVCEKRVEGVRRIIEEHPEIELIVMDDGFQHRYVKPWINIIMVDARRPISSDEPLPLGSLRDTPHALHRASYFVVTKCPESMTQSERKKMREELIVEPDQRVYFSRIVNLDPTATYPDIAPPFDPSASVVAMAGIGNPKPLLETLRDRYKVVEELIYRDHHSYTPEDIERITRRLEEKPNSVIVTTEKDSIKFLASDDITQIIKERLYYTPIRIKFIDGEPTEMLTKIKNYVR